MTPIKAKSFVQYYLMEAYYTIFKTQLKISSKSVPVCQPNTIYFEDVWTLVYELRINNATIRNPSNT